MDLLCRIRSVESAAVRNGVAQTSPCSLCFKLLVKPCRPMVWHSISFISDFNDCFLACEIASGWFSFFFFFFFVIVRLINLLLL